MAVVPRSLGVTVNAQTSGALGGYLAAIVAVWIVCAIIASALAPRHRRREFFIFTLLFLGPLGVGFAAVAQPRDPRPDRGGAIGRPVQRLLSIAEGTEVSDDNGDYGEPPTVGGEEAGEEFAEPEAGEVESAEVSATAEVLAGVPATLLEVKAAIEQQLVTQAAEQAGAVSAESYEGAGNIQGVAIGLGDEGLVTAGEPGDPTLTVYLADEASVDQVRAVLVDSLGVQAAAVDEAPINVVVTGLIEARPHTVRDRPAPGAVSTGNIRERSAGTLGCLARGRTAPRIRRLLVLSNNHVIALTNNGRFGDCIPQPCPLDGGKCPADQIAILERFVPINFASGAVNYVDCATGWCWPARVRRELVYVSAGVRRYFRIGSVPVPPVLGMAVGKYGRTTQLTSGRVTGVGVTVNVGYGGGRVAHFRDQIAIRAHSGDFSRPGDSGSVVWTWDSAEGSCFGLLFAGGGKPSLGQRRMDRVVAALGINLWT